MSGNPNDCTIQRRQSPPATQKQLMKMVKPMLLSGLPNPNNTQVSVEHQFEQFQLQKPNQPKPQIYAVEENVNLQMNQQGQLNGENVKLDQNFRLSVRRDLF